MPTRYKKYEEWTQDRRMKLDPKKHDEIRERYKIRFVLFAIHHFKQ